MVTMLGDVQYTKNGTVTNPCGNRDATAWENKQQFVSVSFVRFVYGLRMGYIHFLMKWIQHDPSHEFD